MESIVTEAVITVKAMVTRHKKAGRAPTTLQLMHAADLHVTHSAECWEAGASARALQSQNHLPGKSNPNF